MANTRKPRRIFPGLQAVIKDYNLLTHLPTIAGKILRGEISDLFDQTPLMGSVNAVTSDGIYRAIQNAAGAGVKTGSTRHNSSDLVSQFIETGWTYYRNRTLPGGGYRFTYGNKSAIDDNWTGNNEIDCSAFIGLMLRGIPYEHSPYAEPNAGIGRNKIFSWSLDPYEFRNVKNEGEDPSRVRTASQLGEWMHDRALQLNYSYNFEEVEPGDIIFYAKKRADDPEQWVEPDRYLHISHISVCVNKIKPSSYNSSRSYNVGDYAYFGAAAAAELGIEKGIHECMVAGTTPEPEGENWRFVVDGYHYHTMLEVTDTEQVVMNRVLELNLAKRIVMIARPDLGAMTDGEFRGNLHDELGIENLDNVWFDCFSYLTQEITGGLPDLLRNTGDAAGKGTGFALKVETTYRKNGQPYSIIQKIIDTRSIHNNEIYTRTKYLLISDEEYYRPDDPAAEWTDWNLIVNKEILDTVMEANGLGELGLDGYGHWHVNNPSPPSEQVPADWNATDGVARILNKPELKTVATSGSYNDLINKPTLFSGNYNDLSGLPYIIDLHMGGWPVSIDPRTDFNTILQPGSRHVDGTNDTYASCLNTPYSEMSDTVSDKNSYKSGGNLYTMKIGATPENVGNTIRLRQFFVPRTPRSAEFYVRAINYQITSDGNVPDAEPWCVVAPTKKASAIVSNDPDIKV